MAILLTKRSPCGHAVIRVARHAGEYSVSLHHHKKIEPKRVGYCQSVDEALSIVAEFERIPLEPFKEWELVK